MKLHVQCGEVVQFLHLGSSSIHSTDKCSIVVDNFGSVVERAN